MFSVPRSLAHCFSVPDLRELARRRLPAPVFHALDGGAESEVTLARNVEGFDRHHLVPRCLTDVGTVNTATRLLGQPIEWPVICSPTGGTRFFHPEGELAVARAVAKAGTLFGLSTSSTYSIEDVARVSDGPKMFQAFILKDRGLTRELIDRARSAGYKALCITVDTQTPGRRERDLRTGMTTPPRMTPSFLASFVIHPGWVLGQARKGKMSVPNLVSRAGTTDLVTLGRFFFEQLDPSVTWDDVREIAAYWNGPFALKGVMHPEDAGHAVEVGATAVFVSNHGGRQLDGAAAPIDVLPHIVEAVDGRLEIVLDGGVRRGVHVLKALAHGATACSVGRACLFGLAAGGEAGVAQALQILRSELVRAMKLAGCADVRAIDRSIIRQFA
jgi:L-lactate dehydrogenase (cytochrome)